MTTKQSTTLALEAVGENIGYELGAKMVKDFQDAYPADVQNYFIGKNIISEILAQPNCAGIRFYNALDELGHKTLVYVGINSKGNVIDEYSTINVEGKIEKHKAIVADRLQKDNTTIDFNNWFD